jgi:hypothetical protein
MFLRSHLAVVQHTIDGLSCKKFYLFALIIFIIIIIITIIVIVIIIIIQFFIIYVPSQQL